MSAIAAIPALLVTLILLAIPTAIVCGVAYVIFKLLKGLGLGLGFVLKGLAGFLKRTLLDTVAAVGALLTGIVVIPLALLNLLLGRLPAAGHYGRAVEDELVSALLSLYRVAVANPLRLIGLNMLSDRLGRRVPDLIASAPRSRRLRRSARKGMFPGYDIVGELPRGGSGAQLYLAKPRREKLAAFEAAGRPLPARVVIKAFALGAGSTLPQIVRESRALEAAGRLGLVLENELTEKSFHYVMPYIEGENLDAEIRKLHARAGSEGLEGRDLRLVLGYTTDLLETLQRFHLGGLWHKDIKPQNLIVAENRVHLVDFGLVTPLQSAMTLTTHGTEYYRDPEMVRLAMRGVRVHQVDGVKFDLYSAGAVLFSMIESSFPAHGSLSRITKRCPEALRWIVRRAMAEMHARYGSAAEMLADVRVVLDARDPFAVVPADLPSVQGQPAGATPRPAAWIPGSAAAFVGSDVPAGSSDPVGEGELPSPSYAPPVTRGTRTRRRRVLRAVAAGLLFVGFLSWADGRNHGHASSTRIEVDHGRPWIRAVETAVSDWRREHGDSSSRPRRRSSLAGLWAEEIGEALPLRGRSARGPAGSVLVLESESPSIEGRIVGGLREELEHRGYEVLGCSAAGPGDEREIALVAGARAAVGLSDPKDVDAVRRLDQFLTGTEDLAAVIWLAPADESEGIFYRLLRRRDVGSEAPRTFALAGGDI